MSLEEQLYHAFETLSQRLRGEIDQEVERRTAEAIAAIPVAPPAPEETAVDAPAAVVDTDATDADATRRLTAAFAAIDSARSLTEVLDALEGAAQVDAPGAAIWLIRGGELHRWRADASADEQDAAVPAIDAGIPLTVGGTPVARLVVESEPPNDAPRTTNLVLLTRYASRTLEALTAFKAARALTQHPDTTDRGLRIADGGVPNGAADSEEETAARRYARLLVSEIKLYHEPAVIDGRRDRDLAGRLGGEITRARVMYEDRVPPHVRARADYFHDELVRTLANGDASLLEVRS